jgi:hypothetical protein
MIDLHLNLAIDQIESLIWLQHLTIEKLASMHADVKALLQEKSGSR